MVEPAAPMRIANDLERRGLIGFRAKIFLSVALHSDIILQTIKADYFLVTMTDSPARAIVNAMTVDVEDYFQVSAFASVVSRDRWGEYESRVAANTDRLLDLFAEFGVHATFFVLGWVAERDPELVRRIAAAGHEIASHGYWHRLVYDQTPAEFRDDVRRSKAVLESICGAPVVGYRAPSFSITDQSMWAFDVLIEEGFTWDASVFPIHHDRYGVPTAPRHAFWGRHVYGGAGLPPPRSAMARLAPPPRNAAFPLPAGSGEDRRPPGPDRRVGPALLEIPASTLRFAGTNLPVGGGGYFRLLPYRWTEWGISHVNGAEGRPIVFYLHPWEIDPGQPRIGAGWLSRFRHYRNLDATAARLRRLMTAFRFDSVSAVVVAEGERRKGPG